MASYNELNALIDAYINRNGVQAITGQILNGVLKAMVEQLGRGYTIMGAATPTTDPGTPDGPECYFASETGTYSDFDGLQVAPGELALLCYTPTGGWTKETIYEGFQTVQATIDGNVGTPSVGVSYSNGVLSFDFRNMKGNPGQNGQDGQDGAAAGFGTIGADITGGIGTPGVSVESSGPATAKNLQFHFTNLKGETGVTSVVATVDNTTGTPACTVSLVGQQLTLAFSGLKGAQGDTGSSVDYPFTIVNNLTTNDATKGLSAAQGVVLDGKVSQLRQKLGDVGTELTLTPSALLPNEGFIGRENGKFLAVPGYYATEYIDVSSVAGNTCKMKSTIYGYAALAFYTAMNESAYISDWNADNIGSYGYATNVQEPVERELPVPNTAKFARMTVFKEYYTSLNELYIKWLPTVAAEIATLKNKVAPLEDLPEDVTALRQDTTDIKDRQIRLRGEYVVFIGNDVIIDLNETVALVSAFSVKKGHLYKIAVIGSSDVVSGNGNVYIAAAGTTSPELRTFSPVAPGTATYEYLADIDRSIDVLTYLQTRGGTIRVEIEDITDVMQSKRFYATQDEIRRKVGAIAGNNLFNKENITRGYYLNSDGVPTALAGYSISDFIPVEMGETYSATEIGNCYYYNWKYEKLDFISGNTFTVPTNRDISFVRLSISDGMLPAFMFNKGGALLPYEQYGGVLTIANFNDALISELKSRLNEQTYNANYFASMLEHLRNPFIKTQIKLIGDSITAGVGGTGFSPTGESIGGSITKTNVLTATCWSNMLYHFVDDVFNKDTEVDLNANGVTRTSGNVVGLNIGGSTQEFPNVNVYVDNAYYTSGHTIKTKMISFSFVGTHFSVRHMVGASYGKFSVSVDGQSISTVDCYAASTACVKTDFTGLSDGEHTVEIFDEATKNASATAGNLWFINLVIPKTAIVKPWGVSGSMTELPAGRVTSDDDFVIVMFGTNDRYTHLSPESTRTKLLEICRSIVNDFGAVPFLMAPPPIAQSQDATRQDLTYFYHANDVHDAVASAANALGVPYVDNYTALLDYAELHNISPGDLLADGLHPNDRGYRAIYFNIMRTLGLGREGYYAEWLGEN